MNKFQSTASDTNIWAHQLDQVPVVFGHPDDVVADTSLSIQEKRAVLASWASDANAVPHLPTLRQLPDGSIVKLDDILRALKALDGSDNAPRPCADAPDLLWQRPFARRARDSRKWSFFRRRSDDDDDPPPCPVGASVRPRTGGGAASEFPEPIFA